MEEDSSKAEILDLAEGRHRFNGMDALYDKFLGKFLVSDSFKKLEENMDDKDYEEAFKIAHDLKGNTGNLSLDKLYLEICKLTEYLRDESDIKSAEDMMPSLDVIYQDTLSAIKQHLNGLE